MGALAAGLIADFLGIKVAIGAVSALTFVSGLVVMLVMYETLPGRHSLRKHGEALEPRAGNRAD